MPEPLPHIQASIEAKIKMEMKKKPPLSSPRRRAYSDGYTDALMWVIDLFDFSHLDVP